LKTFLFLAIFFVFAGGVATYLTSRLFGKTALCRSWKIAIGASIVAIFFTIPVTLLLRRAGIENAAIDVLVWSGYLGLGFLSFIFTFQIVRDIFILPALFFRIVRIGFRGRRPKKSLAAVPENPLRRGFLINGANYGMMAAAGVLTVYGVAQAKKIPGVKRITIPVANLPADLDGFKIVQITDIHVSPTIRRPFVEEVVRVVNGLGADIVALTGDLVDGTVPQLARDVAPLADVKSELGNFFVTGNHEYYSGVVPWVKKIQTLGFTVLLNEHRVISRGRGRLLVGGVTDYRGGSFMPSHRSDPGKAAAGAPPVDMKILLAHQPKSISGAARAGFDFQISGHTHGGQFFPWNFFIGLIQPFVAGLHQFRKTRIYVSRGTGYWGPPVRVGVPSEITVLKLAAI
jgi:uncharacterized protein